VEKEKESLELGNTKEGVNHLYQFMSKGKEGWKLGGDDGNTVADR